MFKDRLNEQRKNLEEQRLLRVFDENIAKIRELSKDAAMPQTMKAIMARVNIKFIFDAMADTTQYASYGAIELDKDWILTRDRGMPREDFDNLPDKDKILILPAATMLAIREKHTK